MMGISNETTARRRAQGIHRAAADSSPCCLPIGSTGHESVPLTRWRRHSPTAISVTSIPWPSDFRTQTSKSDEDLLISVQSDRFTKDSSSLGSLLRNQVMYAFDEERPALPGRRLPARHRPRGVMVLGGMLLLGLGLVLAVYNACKIDIGTGQQAVLIRLEGLEIEPDMELAPPPRDGRAYYKGVQSGGPNGGVLIEGRYFYNPYYWSWEISPQFVVPGDKIGIRIALSGDDLPAGQILAQPGQKGILREVLKPGRYPYNPYAEAIELHAPVTIAAGFRGVVTLLAGPLPKDPNVFLVEEGERGVQSKTLEPGTYYLNPYETLVSMVDCRSRRFNLGQDAEMSFLSADGFPITLDGVVEFRVLPAKVAEMFVKYNEDANGDAIDEEIIAKIIMPESRSLCRVGGSKLSGGQFISGDDREKFQTDLVKSLTQNCQTQGIEILAVAITSIKPPDDITQPVQQREVAKQKVAQTQLEATKDKASAILAKAQADAEVIKFDNAAEAAGLAAQVTAFDGDGSAMARNMLLGKLAPSFRTILGNSEGPLMDLFSEFTRRHDKSQPLPSASPSPRTGGSHTSTSTSTSRPAEPTAASQPGQSPSRSDQLPVAASEENKP